MLALEQLMARVARHYETNLAPLALGQAPFPLRFERLGAPTARTPLTEWREWSEELARGAAVGTGRGYTVEYARREFRALGEQQVPVAIIFATEADLLARLGKTTELLAVRSDLALIGATVPALKPWAEANVTQVRDWHRDWSNLLEVVTFFLAHPYPGIYPREVPIAIADKFIEQHRPQLRELLDAVLPQSSVKASEDFRERFGLKFMPQLVRVRLPDDLKSAGLSAGDISLRLDEWSSVPFSPRMVLVVENLTTFLALPLRSGIPLVWGSGWGAVSLPDIAWIRGAEVIYWGDVDPTGFAILAALRGRHAATRSAMMDTRVLDSFGHLAAPCTVKSDPGVVGLLHPGEAQTFVAVSTGCLQLAQEKLPFPAVLEALDAIL
jgi:hypothetical protein